jgi:hypothetical protein
LAKKGVPDPIMGEFSAENWEFSCLFFQKS